MGTYTTNQKLYRVDGDEVVDVETAINYNWDRLDDRNKRLVEWYPTSAQPITGNEPQESGFKYLKRESNSKWFSFESGGSQVLFQDTSAFTPTWNLVTPSGGYVNWDPLTRLMYARMGDTVHWRGRIALSGDGELPIKAFTTVATGVPTEARPPQHVRVQTMGGNAPAGMVSTITIRFLTTGTIEFIKYGTAQSFPGGRQTYISFSGIEYLAV